MIHISNITKQYGNKVLYRNGSFQINAGEKIGLVGPNGHGKSTIFKIIMGEEGIDSGSISKPDRVTVGYFSQNIEEMSGKTVLEEVKMAAGRVGGLKKQIEDLEARLAEPMEIGRASCRERV